MPSERRTDEPHGSHAENPGPEPTEPHRANVPGELDRASGEVEEFEAGLVSGAEGEPDDGATSDAELDRLATERMGDLDDDGDVDDEDRAMAQDAEARAAAEDAAEAAPAGAPAVRRSRAVGEPTTGGGPRFIQFLKASWAELQRVQWPDRKQVGQATAVVIGFVIVAGAYLGLADWIAKKIVDVVL